MKHPLRKTRRTSGKESIDHRESIPGQMAPTLCGWEGGYVAPYIEGDGTPECKDCIVIYKWAGGK